MTACNCGRTLNRWSNIVTCVIEKSPGNSKINRLRVIHLFEADFNLILKIMRARKCVWHMHNNGIIHDGQAGSRPGKRAIDVVVQKEQKYLYAKLTRTVLGTIDHDAKSCFDWILCNLAMAISLYCGIPSKFCKLLANNLKSSQFRIRTALGDSQGTYSHSIETPIHGTGQGSTALPSG
jgi:hypothetical protein